MKTTIEIPDAVARRAKILAAERHTTLRGLVLLGLEKVLNEEQMTAKERSERLFAAMDQLTDLSAKNRLTRDEANAR
jgi:hypothetical protein